MRRRFVVRHTLSLFKYIDELNVVVIVANTTAAANQILGCVIIIRLFIECKDMFAIYLAENRRV